MAVPGSSGQWAGVAWQNQFEDHGIRALEEWLGLPVDGVFDADLDNKVKGYQALFGQTPGELRGPEDYDRLVQGLQSRHVTSGGNDPLPLQDTAFQAFMRNAGAEEGSILDEIRYRTEQSQREINRRAAGFQADRSETNQAFDTQTREGTQNIRGDFSARGLIGSSAQGAQTSDLLTQLGQKRAAQLGGIDQSQMEFETGQRDALSESRRALMGDVQGLYRRKVDEELAARDRIGRQAAEATYGG